MSITCSLGADGQHHHRIPVACVEDAPPTPTLTRSQLTDPTADIAGMGIAEQRIDPQLLNGHIDGEQITIGNLLALSNLHRGMVARMITQL